MLQLSRPSPSPCLQPRATSRELRVTRCRGHSIGIGMYHPVHVFFCDLGVSWQHKAICCGSCNVWYHNSCIELCSSDYEHLQHSSVDWVCAKINTALTTSQTRNSPRKCNGTPTSKSNSNVSTSNRYSPNAGSDQSNLARTN